LTRRRKVHGAGDWRLAFLIDRFWRKMRLSLWVCGMREMSARSVKGGRMEIFRRTYLTGLMRHGSL
jgi:hypothetical protein